jgi:Asp-tRNA(Asn)/Glu-tRNA(Gln) amidotransferase A subunit family amidase
MRNKWRIVIMGATLLIVSGIASAASPALAASGDKGTFHLQEATIDDIHEALKSGQITCRGLVQHYLNRIEAYDKHGPALNAIQFINPNALQEADKLDMAFKSSGPVGPLHCIPVLVKDEVETSDMPTTYGSAVFNGFVPKRDATIVKKMKKAGAIILGKTTMGEYAFRYIGSAYGIARNAYDRNRNPSGSSAGTGVAIAANFATVGIGEDTGGSIRGPASVLSLVGLRPSVPLVSRYGMMPFTPSMDTLGPLTRTVKDTAILLDVIAGYDPNEPITAASMGKVPDSYKAFLSKDGLKGARIGVVREAQDAKTDPTSEDYKKVKVVIDKAISDMRKLGATVVDPVTIPKIKELTKRSYLDNCYETEEAVNKYLKEHPNAPVQTLAEIVSSGKVIPWIAKSLMGYVGKSTNDPGYLQVLLAREEAIQTVLKVMADNEVDVLVYSTFDHQPTLISPDVLTNPSPKDGYGLGGNRYLWSGLVWPDLTVQAGFTTDGLPVGISFVAPPFSERMLLKLASAYEQGTLNRKPPALTPKLPTEP